MAVLDAERCAGSKPRPSSRTVSSEPLVGRRSSIVDARARCACASALASASLDDARGERDRLRPGVAVAREPHGRRAGAGAAASRAPRAGSRACSRRAAPRRRSRTSRCADVDGLGAAARGPGRAARAPAARRRGTARARRGPRRRACGARARSPRACSSPPQPRGRDPGAQLRARAGSAPCRQRVDARSAPGAEAITDALAPAAGSASRARAGRTGSRRASRPARAARSARRSREPPRLLVEAQLRRRAVVADEAAQDGLAVGVGQVEHGAVEVAAPRASPPARRLARTGSSSGADQRAGHARDEPRGPRARADREAVEHGATTIRPACA